MPIHAKTDENKANLLNNGVVIKPLKTKTNQFEINIQFLTEKNL